MPQLASATELPALMERGETPDLERSTKWTPLVNRIMAGDAGAIEMLSSSLSSLRPFFCARLGEGEAEDAFQDLMLQLTIQIRKGALRDPERLLGYAHAIVRHQLAGRIRGRIRDRCACQPDDVELRDQQRNPEELLAVKERRDLVMRVVNALPALQKEMLIRFYVHGERPEKIQRDLAISETQFRLIKCRAKARVTELCQATLRRGAKRHEMERGLPSKRVA